MADTVTLSTTFRTSLPKALHDANDWKAGQKFAFLPKGAGVLLVPVPERAELAGTLRGARATRYRDRKDRF